MTFSNQVYMYHQRSTKTVSSEIWTEYSPTVSVDSWPSLKFVNQTSIVWQSTYWQSKVATTIDWVATDLLTEWHLPIKHRSTLKYIVHLIHLINYLLWEFISAPVTFISQAYMLDYCENTPKYEHKTHHFQPEKCPCFAISSVPIQATAEKIYNFTPELKESTWEILLWNRLSHDLLLNVAIHIKSDCRDDMKQTIISYFVVVSGAN